MGRDRKWKNKTKWHIFVIIVFIKFCDCSVFFTKIFCSIYNRGSRRLRVHRKLTLYSFVEACETTVGRRDETGSQVRAIRDAQWPPAPSAADRATRPIVYLDRRSVAQQTVWLALIGRRTRARHGLGYKSRLPLR